jgi:RNase H-fold protein (predicted Holliday junction resolvase)
MSFYSFQNTYLEQALAEDVQFVIENNQSDWLNVVAHDESLSSQHASKILRQNVTVVQQIACIPHE